MYLSFINRLVSFALRPYTLNLKSTFSSLFFMFFFFISSSRSLLLLICCTFCVITFGRCRCFYARFYFDHFVVIGIENELRKLLWQFFCVNNWSVFLETWTFEQAQQVLMVIFFLVLNYHDEAWVLGTLLCFILNFFLQNLLQSGWAWVKNCHF